MAVRLRRVVENLRKNGFSLRRIVALLGLIVGFLRMMVWILPDFGFRDDGRREAHASLDLLLGFGSRARIFGFT